MQRQVIEKYILNTYDAASEKPWAEYPSYTTFKHKSNHKWLALVMNVPCDRLGLERAGEVDVVNLKVPPEMLADLHQRSGVLPAYHMNKEHWISVLLDDTMPTAEIEKLVDISAALTRGEKI